MGFLMSKWGTAKCHCLSHLQRMTPDFPTGMFHGWSLFLANRSCGFQNCRGLNSCARNFSAGSIWIFWFISAVLLEFCQREKHRKPVHVVDACALTPKLAATEAITTPVARVKSRTYIHTSNPLATGAYWRVTLPGSFVHTRMVLHEPCFWLRAFALLYEVQSNAIAVYSYRALAWKMSVALIGQTSKCLAFLDKLFMDAASFWPRHDASFLLASYTQWCVENGAHTFELNFFTLFFTLSVALFVPTSVKKNVLVTVSFYVRALTSELNCCKLGDISLPRLLENYVCL